MYAYIFVFNYRVYFIFTKFATLPTKKKNNADIHVQYFSIWE